MTTCRLALLPALAMLASIAANPTQAAVDFYTSQAAFNGAASTVVIEDFEATGQPLHTILPGFSHNGLTFTPLAGGVPTPNVYIYPPGGTEFGGGISLPTTTTVLTGNGEEHFRVDFSTPANAVGFDVYLNGLGPLTIDVFNGSSLLGSFAFPSSQNDQTYLGMISSTPITGFEWTATNGGTINTAIDNIAADLPEPGTLGLLGVALAGLLARRRR